MSAYREALAAATKTGISHATDAQFMAAFCQSNIQILCGALSPELVWDGAQKKGLTTKQLAELANTNPRAVEDLMWI